MIYELIVTCIVNVGAVEPFVAVKAIHIHN